MYGYGTEADPEKAYIWYKKAADAGDPLSMFKVGYMLSEGVGCQKDTNAAVHMFRLSATAGLPESMFKMAQLTLEGTVPGGPVMAMQWYRGAADQGFAPARFNLATMLYEGRGVDADREEAFKLYKGLADEGDADALFMVGRMYFEGIGVEKDQGKGFEYFGRAADAGNQVAMELVENIRRRQNTQFITIDGL